MIENMIRFAVISDKGNRTINEDSVAACEKGTHKCFVLCDGLGGHGMGDIASKTVCEAIKAEFMAKGCSRNFLESAFENAQNRLLNEQLERKATQKMKTTAVVLAADDKNAYIGHIGDSRCYIFSKNKVKCRTLDHSVPQMLVTSHQIKESEIRFHPDRSMLMSVMGVEWEKPMYELMKPVPLKKCQAFLLCSDGFWELIVEDDMCNAFASSNDVEDWLNEMTKIVLANGKNCDMDNYSAIAVWNV